MTSIMKRTIFFPVFVLLLCVFCQGLHGQPFFERLSYEDFNRWMRSSKPLDYGFIDSEREGEETSKTVTYTATFMKSGKVLSVGFSPLYQFNTYKYMSDFKDVAPYERKGYNTVFLDNEKMKISSLYIELKPIEATFSISSVPKLAREELEQIVDLLRLYENLQGEMFSRLGTKSP